MNNLPNDLDLGAGFKIKSDPSSFPNDNKSPVNFPEEARAKEEALDILLFENIAEYIGSHTLEFKFSPEISTQNGVEG